MNNLVIGSVAIGIYLISATGFILATLQREPRSWPLYLGWLATGLHSMEIAHLIQQYQGFSFSFFNIASFIACLVSLLLLLAAIGKPIEKLGIIIFPIAAAMLGLNLAFPNHTAITPEYSGPLYLHILTSIIAFSLLNIAAIQAVLLALQEQQLRNHTPKRVFLSLPSLQTMEALLFQMIGTGVFFLSIALGSGFVFIEDLFAQHLAHKTILSLLAWLIFSGLICGRLRYGWRGKTAIKWTLIGFALLLLAYFGSKLVLELILHRS